MWLDVGSSLRMEGGGGLGGVDLGLEAIGGQGGADLDREKTREWLEQVGRR